jgi:hypothetical protein
MKAAKQIPLRAQAEGYWAVEIRMSDTAALRPQYLCHAGSDLEAKRIAGDLMGPTAAVHGYNYYRLELPIGGRGTSALPALGAWEAVTAEGWPHLMLAHAASEALAKDNLSRAQ